jgi:biopolymer transport protein ExbB/biopolymer transport protein TolQ
MMGNSVLDIWNTMGPLAKGIAIFMVLMSIYSFGVFIERYLFFRAAKKQSIDYLPLATKALREGNYNAAVDASKRFSKSHLAKVLAAGLQQFLFEREEEPTHDAVESVRLAVERAAALTTAEMKKGLGGLATIGATAPFIGLLGTVIGIINAFTGMAATGSGGIGSVSAGIAEALINTAAGLAAAIPAVIAYNHFLARIGRMTVRMENFASEFAGEGDRILHSRQESPQISAG